MRLVKQTNKPQRAHVIRLLAPLSLLAFAFIGAYANAQVAPQNPAPNPPTKTAGPTPSPASAPIKSKYSRICTENERMWCLQQHIGQKASQEMKRQCPEDYRAFAEANQCSPWWKTLIGTCIYSLTYFFRFQNTPKWLNSQHLLINRHPNTQSQLQKARWNLNPS